MLLLTCHAVIHGATSSCGTAHLLELDLLLLRQAVNLSITCKQKHTHSSVSVIHLYMIQPTDNQSGVKVGSTRQAQMLTVTSELQTMTPTCQQILEARLVVRVGHSCAVVTVNSAKLSCRAVKPA